MPNIRPAADLQNYNDVLCDVSIGEPVFLTENGHPRYVIMDIAEYEQTHALLKLLSELTKGEKAARKRAGLLRKNLRPVCDAV